MPAADPQHEIFGISAVSRLTGISSHTIRIWERRYQVVEPGRSDSKRREYTREEIRRLTLLKALVDQGHAIRNVAPLSTGQLEKRLRESSESASRQGESGANRAAHTCRVAFSGAITRDALREAAEAAESIRLVGDYADLEELRGSLRDGSIDLVIAELPYLFPEAIYEIQETIVKIGARRAIVIYRFASSETIGPLDKDIRNITAMRAPVDANELKLACLADVALAGAPTRSPMPGAEEIPEVEGEIPERKFSEAKLAKIARHSSVVQCECPRHLANLLSSLNAFESYSAACENRNEDDAKLHGYLHQATAECRSQMEAALQQVLVAENITVD